MSEIHSSDQRVTDMVDYPMPIVQEGSARKQAQERIYSVRQHKHHAEEAQKIVAKHSGGKKRMPRKPSVLSRLARTEVTQGRIDKSALTQQKQMTFD